MLYPVLIAIVAILASALTKSPDIFGAVLGLGIVLPIGLYIAALALSAIQRKSKQRD